MEAPGVPPLKVAAARFRHRHRRLRIRSAVLGVVDEGVEDSNRVGTSSHKAITASGSRPACACVCARASSPMTR